MIPKKVKFDKCNYGLSSLEIRTTEMVLHYTGDSKLSPFESTYNSGTVLFSGNYSVRVVKNEWNGVLPWESQDWAF